MKSKNIYYFFITFLLCLIVSAYSISQVKYTISGFVKDKEGKALSNIYVLCSNIVPPGMGMPTILYKSISDSTGFYKLESIEGGRNYQVNAMREGLTFDPSVKVFENLNENKKLDFMALFSTTTNFKVSISGTIKDNKGIPLKDVQLQLSGLREYKTLTDLDGNYKFENSEVGNSFKLIPLKSGFIFNPSYKVYQYNTVENITQDFIAIQQSSLSYTIAGYIFTKSAGILPSDIVAELSGSKTDRIIVDKSGLFIFNNLEGGKNYTVTPYHPILKFDPVKYDIINLSEDKKVIFNALISGNTKYSISGTVLDKNSKPITNVKVVLRSNNEIVSFTDDKGLFKFDKLDSAYSYTIQPQKDGYIFEPKNIVILSLLENKTLNFIGTQLPSSKLTISGYCKDKDLKGIPEVELSLRGSIESSFEFRTKSDLNGFYKFENLSPGMPYTVTAQKVGFQFDPKSKTFNLLLTDTSQNFIGLPIIQSKFIIDGFIYDRNQLPIAGAIIEIIGGIPSKVLSDEKGYFKFDQLDGNLRYSIVVNKEGFLFEPKTFLIEKLTQNMTLKFLGVRTLQVTKYSIKGSIADKDSRPLANIQIQLGGEKFESAKTDLSGNFSFMNLDSGKFYSVMALSPDYTFNPRGKSFENLNHDEIQNFIATPVSNTKYSISGFARDKDNKPIPEVIMVLGGEMNIKVITGSDGFYKFDGLIGGRFYTVIPNKRGLVFDPHGKGFEPLNENKEQNFVGTQIIGNSFSISGFISNENLGFMSGITLKLSGDRQTETITDENGFFSFDNLEEGKQYIITPLKTGLTFNPPTIAINGNPSANAININSTLDNKLTDIKKSDIIPNEIYLYQNYPNPFNPSTVISYQLPVNSFVTLKIYNVLGKEIEALVNENQTSGIYNISWSPKSTGRELPSGIYYYRLQTEKYTAMKKMIYIR